MSDLEVWFIPVEAEHRNTQLNDAAVKEGIRLALTYQERKWQTFSASFPPLVLRDNVVITYACSELLRYFKDNT